MFAHEECLVQTTGVNLPSVGHLIQLWLCQPWSASWKTVYCLMSLDVWHPELSGTWSLGKLIKWKVPETKGWGCPCYFYLFHTCVFPGQRLTGIKARLGNWSSQYRPKCELPCWAVRAETLLSYPFSLYTLAHNGLRNSWRNQAQKTISLLML